MDSRLTYIYHETDTFDSEFFKEFYDEHRSFQDIQRICPEYTFPNLTILRKYFDWTFYQVMYRQSPSFPSDSTHSEKCIFQYFFMFGRTIGHVGTWTHWRQKHALPHDQGHPNEIFDEHVLRDILSSSTIKKTQSLDRQLRQYIQKHKYLPKMNTSFPWRERWQQSHIFNWDDIHITSSQEAQNYLKACFGDSIVKHHFDYTSIIEFENSSTFFQYLLKYFQHTRVPDTVENGSDIPWCIFGELPLYFHRDIITMYCTSFQSHMCCFSSFQEFQLCWTLLSKIDSQLSQMWLQSFPHPIIALIDCSQFFRSEMEEEINMTLFEQSMWTPPFSDIWFVFESIDQLSRYHSFVDKFRRHHMIHIILSDQITSQTQLPPPSTCIWSWSKTKPFGFLPETVFVGVAFHDVLVVQKLPSTTEFACVDDLFRPYYRPDSWVQENETTYATSGDLGDVFYSTLNVDISSAHHRTLFIKYNPQMKMSFHIDRFVNYVEWIRSTLVHFSIFHSVFIWNNEVIDVDLDMFRNHSHNPWALTQTLCEFVCQVPNIYHRIGTTHWILPWTDDLYDDHAPHKERDIIVFRSERYRSLYAEASYRYLLHHFADRLLFIGTPREHTLFEKEMEHTIFYYPIRDFIDACYRLQTASLVVGNGTLFMAFAYLVRPCLPILEEKECFFHQGEHPSRFIHCDSLCMFRSHTYYLEDMSTQFHWNTLSTMYLDDPRRFPQGPQDTVYRLHKKLWPCFYHGMSINCMEVSTSVNAFFIVSYHIGSLQTFLDMKSDFNTVLEQQEMPCVFFVTVSQDIVESTFGLIRTWVTTLHSMYTSTILATVCLVVPNYGKDVMNKLLCFDWISTYSSLLHTRIRHVLFTHTKSNKAWRSKIWDPLRKGPPSIDSYTLACARSCYGPVVNNIHTVRHILEDILHMDVSFYSYYNDDHPRASSQTLCPHTYRELNIDIALYFPPETSGLHELLFHYNTYGRSEKRICDASLRQYLRLDAYPWFAQGNIFWLSGASFMMIMTLIRPYMTLFLHQLHNERGNVVDSSENKYTHAWERVFSILCWKSNPHRVHLLE